MKAKYDNDQEWAADRMRYLCGCTLTAVLTETDGGATFTGLCFESDSESGRQFTVWVQADAEGNNGGFLNIHAENEAASEVLEEMDSDRRRACA